jgi:peptidoglycan/LPS O-acetylase OafA/YrhL
MLAYSGHWMNDLGRFSRCKEIPGSQYVVLAIRRKPWVLFAACGPESCTKDDYYEIMKGVLGVPFVEMAVKTQDPVQDRKLGNPVIPLGTLSVHFPFEFIDGHLTLHGGALAMLIFILLLLALCLIATAADLYLTLNSTKDSLQCSKPTSLLLSFSYYTNFKKIMQPTVSRSGENLAVLNGLRVLSIGWVIVGHVCSFRMRYTPIVNIFDLLDVIDKPKFAIVYGAFYAVDTFFWLGGFLVAYLLIKEIKSKGKLNWFMVYFHRFWRIVPLFMFVTCLVWGFQGYGQAGPLWFQNDDSSVGCAQYWWANLLFINNFVPDGKSSDCLVVAWYMSNDMQFYLITPVILYVYVKFQRAYGWIAVGLLSAISVITAWEVAAKYDLNVVVIAPDNAEYTYYYYVKPYCRVAPYALGLACGFIMAEVKQYEKSNEIWDKIAYCIGKCVNNAIGAWVTFAFGVFLISLLVFVQYDVWKDNDLTFSTWSKAQNIQFIAWNRLAYGFGMSCLMLPILLGHIKPAEWFLSLPIWSPLAKLTFSVYLIHLSIVARVTLGVQSSYYFSDLNVVKDLLMFVFLSYIAALLITLTVESPIMGMEKVLFHSMVEQKDQQKGKTSS